MDLKQYLERVKNNRFIPMPPKEKIFVGGSDADFRQIGVDTLGSLIDVGHVRPDSKVLEIGSGIGRVALPLTQWLDSAGQYVGTDIVQFGVDWCNENISSRYENFRFICMDIYNEYYNPQGRERIGDLPLEAGYFDVAVFNSVFTHLVADDTIAYLKLVAKHLAKGGILWGTWFIMDAEARALTRDNRSSLKFIQRNGNTFHLDEDGVSTAAVAYDIDYVREALSTAGFEIERLDLGKWCDRTTEFGGYQDLIVARLV
jgi:SAM-dependent methyltransferase